MKPLAGRALRGQSCQKLSEVKGSGEDGVEDERAGAGQRPPAGTFHGRDI